MSYKNICILGAGGSIGSRLVAILLSQGYQLTAVVRSLSSAVRIGRFDIPIVAMDLLSATKEELASVMANHDVVIDCTFSNNSNYDQRLLEAQQLAELICDAALHANVKRLIHYGTISVYPSKAGTINETTPCVMQGESYGDSKLAAEIVFLSRSTEQLPITVLQLPIVFGAFMGWSTSPITQMTAQRLLMPDDIRGHCSPLYVDDVASATIAAFDCPDSHGERILLSDKAMTWFDYYSAYARLSEGLAVQLIKRSILLDLHHKQARAQRPFQRLKAAFSSDGEFRQLMLAQWGIRTLYKYVKRYRGQEGVDKIKTQIARSLHEQAADKQAVVADVAIDERTLNLFDGMPVVDTHKSRQVLQFEAYTPFDEAIRFTGEWLTWARLIK